MMILDANKLADALRMMNKGVKTVLVEHDGSSDLREAAAFYAALINGINACDQYESMYNYHPMSEYRIPSSLIQFVYPRSIKFDVTKIRYKDLLVRPKPPMITVTLADIEWANNVYAKNIKEAKVETKPVTDGRVDRNLSDMLEQIEVEGKVYYTVEDSFLYAVIPEVASIIGDSEFSKDVAEVEELFYKTFARKNS